MFEVTPDACHVLNISKLCGFNISKGWAGDLMDTPDPYLVFRIKDTPNGKKQTKHVDNNTNPEWSETFDFYLESRMHNVLEIKLMDANYTIDETLGTYEYDLSDLVLDDETEACFSFTNNSCVKAVLLLKLDERSDLRYSLALCDEEKAFLQKRWQKVMQNMQTLLGERAPTTVREVPVVSIVGSGGGFRAMVCLSGVIKALSDSGVFDCVTYAAGLSGSSWFLSTLYSHPDFPQRTPGELQLEMKQDINQSPFSLVTPQGLYRYLGAIVAKHLSGQPVSFTDFFGHMLGDTLLRRRKECRLTDQQAKLMDGAVPLPLYTCLHVKKNVTAKVFQEWLEFSPYEVGIAKYGTFMKSGVFGSKMYLGHVVKRYPEFPLHYLQGVWGSAFCILFKQLVQENGRKDLAQMMRESESEHNEAELDKQLENFLIEDDGHSDSEDEVCERPHSKIANDNKPSDNINENIKTRMDTIQERRTSFEKRQSTETSLWKGMVNSLCTSSWLDTCAGRAGMIHNPLRGLGLNYLYPLSPFSPTTPNDDVDFKGIHEALPTDAKKLYLVDGGLTFNSPFPLLLRPQRGVDVYLSFDFSARPQDQTPPFKELLLAEKWAKTNNLLFPPIENQVKEYAKEPVRECYIFKHPRDPFCPTIIHFVIVNNKFRTYKAPGELRETAEETEFGDFDVFDDPENPYSLYNFNYSSLQFDRMSQLMEFNALDSLGVIKEVLADAVDRKRNTLPRPPVSLLDITKLKFKFRSKDAFKRFKAYVRTFSRDDVRKPVNRASQSSEVGNSDDEYLTPEED